MERKRGRFLIFFLFLLIPLSLSSEFIRIYGLPRCRIRGLEQDGLGFIWVLTDKGIFVGEGRAFRPLPQLQQRIKGRVICLSPSRKGMWLATDKGELVLWNWSELKVYRWSKGPVLDMKEEKDGLLVCSHEGVFKWNAERREKPFVSAPVKRCWRDGWLWVQLQDKFLKCASSGCSQVDLPKEASSPQALCPLPEAFALLDDAGVFWIKGKNGLKQLKFPFKNITFLKFAKGKIWIGNHQGLWTFSPENGLVRIFSAIKPLHMLQDWEGNLWLSTERDLYLNPAIPGIYPLPSSPVILFKNKEGKRLSLSSDGRLFELREKPLFVSKLDFKGRIKTAAYCDGKLMFKSGEKFYIWQNRRVRKLKGISPGVEPVGCYRGKFIFKDKQSLYFLEGKSLQRITLLPSRIIKVKSRGEEILILTVSGLFKWKGVLRKIVDGRDIVDFTVDNRGKLWLAASSGVLLCEREGSGCRRVALPELSPDVLSIAFDGSKFIWIVTSSEVVVLDDSGRERALFHFPLRIKPPVIALSFGEGSLWLAAGRKLFLFSLKELRGKPPVAAVKFLKVDGKLPDYFQPLSSLGRKKLHLKLSPPPHRLVLSFSTFSFLSPKGVTGFLQLDGPTGKTIHAAKGGELVLSPTLPGKYRIILRACRRGRLCSDPVAIFIELKGTPLSLGGFVKKILLLLIFTGLLLWGIYNSYRSALFRRQVSLNTYKLMQAKAKIQQQNIMLAELSRTDPLTGLHNRRVLEEQLSLEIALIRREADQIFVRRTGRFTGSAVIMLDLDNFKEVNDRFGHEAGDRVLKAIALSLKATLRETDLLVRWGGEEFIILARKLNRKGLMELVRRALVTIRNTEVKLQSGDSISLTASAGFVCYPLCLRGLIHPGEWMMLVDVADRFLYLAKQAGKARAFGVVWKNPWVLLASERAILQRILKGDQHRLKCVETVSIVPQSAKS